MCAFGNKRGCLTITPPHNAKRLLALRQGPDPHDLVEGLFSGLSLHLPGRSYDSARPLNPFLLGTVGSQSVPGKRLTALNSKPSAQVEG